MREQIREERPPDLSGALIFGENGHLLSDQHQKLAEEIAYRYENIRLVYIPVSERDTEAEKKYPFALIDVNTGRLIRRFEEHGDYPRGVMWAIRWLWENDSQREDTYSKYMAEQNAIKQARKTHEEDAFAEVADLAAHAILSPLHTFKHHGVKITDGYRMGQADLTKEYRENAS